MLPNIDRASDEPIRRQIYHQLRAQILNGTLRQGEALASTRQMASDLAVSRSTVVEAYDMLLAEGFLESKQGSQTVVANGIAMQVHAKPAGQTKPEDKCDIRADFTTGRPDLASFPRTQWNRLLLQAAQTLSAEDYGYTGPQGFAPLREEIAAWLSRSRGIAVSAEDVFITAGATHALRILSDLLCGAGGRVMLEDPCHKGLYDTLIAGNCEIVSVPADDHGMRTDTLTGDEHAQMIYVTPSHQFPLGGILPASRRATLIRYAREQGIYIVEDDYDSEFRFSGAPISPLVSMDAERVIYVGTFSKTMFPALRIGYAILPKELQSRWRYLRTHHDVQNPIFEQAALAMFLRSRAFDRHIRTMRARYAKRRQALAESLRFHFGESCVICGDAAGLHLAVRIKGYSFEEDFQAFCRARGIVVKTMEAHSIVKGQHKDQLVLGYGHLEPEQIIEGVRLLANAILEYERR
jgi:GntR family transcriptional regulator/MocR family aminotransferase